MPLYRFAIETGLTKEATVARINELVGSPRAPWEGVTRSPDLGDAARPFVGKAGSDWFRARRNILYRNSFLPTLWGRITSRPAGSRVHVTMFMHPLVTVFMSVWFFGVGYGAVSLFESTDALFRWAAVVPLGLLFFGVALVCRGFFPEALEARRLLERALSRSLVR